MSRTVTPEGHGLGYIPDLPDVRDRLFTIEQLVALPPAVDLRDSGFLPPVVNQGALGSCTANAIAGAVDFENNKQGGTWITPSRLFIYYGERDMEGTVNSDAGAMIRDGIKVVAKQGAPPETDWPYDISQFTHKPPVAAYTHALQDGALTYRRVDRTHWRQALAQGCPVVIGFSVYESFESTQVAQDGMVPVPAPHERLLGGHAVLVVGYRKIGGVLYAVVRNSWGTGWGDAGYFYLPSTFISRRSLSSDFWTISATGALA